MAQEEDIKAEALGKPPKDLEPQAYRLLSGSMEAQVGTPR